MDQLRTYHWGILGCGRISHDFICALNSPDRRFTHVVQAVSTNNDLIRAEDFAKTHGVVKAYSNYEELCKDSKIDIVYIGTINSCHYENAKLALHNKKHVLVEKPIALKTSEIKELFLLAKEKNCFLMEGLWTRTIPLFQKIDKLIADNKLGAVMSVLATFPSSSYKRVDRVKKAELGGGGLYDVGIYPLQLGLFCYDDRKPDDIIVTGVKDENNVDTVSNINLIYHGKGMANCFCTTLQAGDRPAMIIGTKASIRMNYTFWTPTEFEVIDKNGIVIETHKGDLPRLSNEETIEMKNKPGYGYFSDQVNFVNSGNLLYEADHVVDCLRQGKIQSDLWGEEKCLNLHKIVEFALNKIRS